MKTTIKFTKKEIIVSLCCIAFLLMNLGAIGNSGRRRAKNMVCLSNLSKWGSIFNAFANDNNGYFHSGEGGESSTTNYRWPNVLQDYYKDINIRLCPMAALPSSEGGRNPFCAWGKLDDGMYASYGFNEWLCNRSMGVNDTDNYWRFIPDAGQPETIPLFLDCRWYDVWVHSTDSPPLYDGSESGMSGYNEIRRVCLNRHDGAVNCLFLDFSARKVALKELWTLKWHRNFDTEDFWTKAGGVMPEDWPEWMKNFKEF